MLPVRGEAHVHAAARTSIEVPARWRAQRLRLVYCRVAAVRNQRQEKGKEMKKSWVWWWTRNQVMLMGGGRPTALLEWFQRLYIVTFDDDGVTLTPMR